MKTKSSLEENAIKEPMPENGGDIVESRLWIKSGASRAERKALGRAARLKVPRANQAKIMIRQSGRDITRVLEESNKGRVPELIPIRYGRMLTSPFTFFRGSAALMAQDLAGTPNSGFIVQACGDCHIQNFGVFATPERKIVVDINDFDETLPAPWEWDVKRLAASLVLAATANKFSAGLGQEAAFLMAQAYSRYMSELSQLSSLQVWYSHIEVDKAMGIAMSETRRRMQGLLKEGMAKSSIEVMMDKLTVKVDGQPRFKDIPPLLCHIEDWKVGHESKQAFDEYLKTLPEDRRVLLDNFKMVDLARKVVGIGSVGTVCGIVLLVGSDNDALILQIKEARKSVLEPYVGASKYSHQGQRVVCGQKLMQAASDMFLGWTTGRAPARRHFFVRQLRDVKIGVNTAYWSKQDFKVLPKLVGEILARAHARSGDAAVMLGYLGKSDAFAEAMAAYGADYAKQTERDYLQFVKACKAGILKAQPID